MPVICEWGCNIPDEQYKLFKQTQRKNGFIKEAETLRYIIANYFQEHTPQKNGFIPPARRP